MHLNHFLGDHQNIGPTVKHDSHQNFGAIISAEFHHLQDRSISDLQWDRKFLFLSKDFLRNQVREGTSSKLVFQFLFKLAFTHIELPFDAAPVTTRRG